MAHVIPFTPRSSSPSGLLRAARERSGLNHADFAGLLGPAIGRDPLSPGTIRAWETGAVTPPAEIVEEAQRVAGRVPSTGLDLTAAPRLAAAFVAPAAVDVTARADVDAVMQAFREADRQVGGGFMYGAVVNYLEKEVGPLLFNGTADLFCAAAALTEMAGWMAHDGGDDARAHQHFDRALRFASATEDVELTAHIHASLSHLVQQLDRPRDGLRLAQAGRSVLRRRDHHPALTARLYAMEARALATLRRRADCARALMTAERALDRVHHDEPSPWVSPFDHASLAAEASVCMQQLAQLVAARQHSEQVLTLRNASHARSRAFGQLRLAGILVYQGEIEHACAMAQAALASSDRLSSSRVVALLHTLCGQLTPHSTVPGVDDVVHVLSTTLATRAHTRLLITAAGNSHT
jgi:transcriptional regulator with XRE-family HTH domain